MFYAAEKTIFAQIWIFTADIFKANLTYQLVGMTGGDNCQLTSKLEIQNHPNHYIQLVKSQDEFSWH